ncbi:MAG TPA: hypothetical protein VK557_10515 [Pyrinomonadaceae bacterium]|nr:hypothetical protein [Pyrinomonadaceae bacterium]
MKRLMALMVAPAFLLIISLTALGLMLLIVNEIKSARHGFVTLKAKANGPPGDVLSGDIVKSDKYVTVTINGTEKIYGWDQIENISYQEAGSFQKLDRVVDLLDLLSKLGIGLTVVVFMVGLHQYGQGQKWEREKFLAGAIKEFVELQTVRNAMKMMDSLTLYRDGRQIEFNPKADRAEDRKTYVSNGKIFDSLTTAPHDELARDDELAFSIRDCFDAFLSYLETFDHYINQDLITMDALTSHVGYWIELLGPEGKLEARFKTRILNYANNYGMSGVENLIQKNQSHSGWDKIVSWFMK